jgi:hypothetical protein
MATVYALTNDYRAWSEFRFDVAQANSLRYMVGKSGEMEVMTTLIT